MKFVASRDNPLVKRLRALSGRARERREQGLALLDGPHLVAAALAHGIELREVVIAEGAAARPEIAALSEACRNVPRWCLPDALFAQVSAVDHPAGILAVMAIPAPPPAPPVRNTLVVLDGVQDPGNLGTLLRTAAAAGIGTALLTAGCAQAWSPRVLRAGMGAHFQLALVEQAPVAALLQGYPGAILATALDAGAVSLFDTDLRGPVAWLFGSEGQGLSAELAALATGRLTIPLAPGTESLNVAAAAAVCLFEQVRQRGGRGAIVGKPDTP